MMSSNSSFELFLLKILDPTTNEELINKTELIGTKNSFDKVKATFEDVADFLQGRSLINPAKT